GSYPPRVVSLDAFDVARAQGGFSDTNPPCTPLEFHVRVEGQAVAFGRPAIVRHPLMALGRISRDHPVVEPEGIDDGDVWEAPAAHPDLPGHENRKVRSGNSRAELPRRNALSKVLVENLVLLVAHADEVIDQPGLIGIEGLRVGAKPAR